MGFWAAGRKRKRREREKDWAGRAKKVWVKKKSFTFSETDSNTFNLNSNSKIKIQTEQQTINNALQHECNTNKTTSINLENNQYIFFYTKFSVKKINVGKILKL